MNVLEYKVYLPLFCRGFRGKIKNPNETEWATNFYFSITSLGNVQVLLIS